MNVRSPFVVQSGRVFLSVVVCLLLASCDDGPKPPRGTYVNGVWSYTFDRKDRVTAACALPGAPPSEPDTFTIWGNLLTIHDERNHSTTLLTINEDGSLTSQYGNRYVKKE